MRMRSLYNAGVWLELSGTTLLIDALEGGYGGYAAAAADVMERRADALLFTHKHPDHFDTRMTVGYMTRYPDCRVFAGDEVTAALAALGEDAQRLVTLKPYERTAIAPTLAVTALPTRHMGPEYRHKEHMSLLLTGERRVLITGDAAPIHNNFEVEGAPLGHVDVMIAPYVYALYEPAQRMFSRTVWTDTLLASHIPQPDAEGVRASLRALAPGARSYRLLITEQDQDVEGI